MKSINHYFKALKFKVFNKTHELFDFQTDKHIIVFESDDWGSIRMPSLEALQRLKSKGYNFADGIGYDRFDTLETADDLEALKDVLVSVHDSLGNPAKITMNFAVANPDFDKIKASGFESYYYEPFTDTLRRQQGNENALDSLRDGIRKGVFQPQFHGREHLNAQMWMDMLRKGDNATIDSFNENLFSMVVDQRTDIRQHVMAAYNISKESEYEFLLKSISDGLDIFERIFGFKSKSMIAPCYTWDSEIERFASSCGIEYLQGSRVQRHSSFALSEGESIDFRHTGEKNNFGQIYTVRNCSFEPSEDSKKDSNFCLLQVRNAFKRGHAAIISAHRQNFIGGLDARNRENNLKDFRILLANVVKEFPDVRFMSSDQFGDYLKQVK